MKLATFHADDATALGAVVDGKIYDLNAASHGTLPDDMLAFIQQGESALRRAQEIMVKPPASAARPLESVRLLAPLPAPPSLRDFFAFADHARAAAERSGAALPEQWHDLPACFKGNHREIYGPEEEIPWPHYTRRFDFECEIACVIGKRGRDISPQQAAEHIFGYTIFNDFSARDIQKKEMLLGMGPAKSKDFANSFGPCLVTADEAVPSRDFSMTVRVNGEQWSAGHSRDQYWSFPLLVSHASQCETVHPGDILGSGTFYGGCGLDLGRWLRPGDDIELEVPGIGVLRNTVGTPDAAHQRELNYRKHPAAKP
ncbi:MAG: fumarylacetoacetate hydrolase family protein [Elusimicrobiota bacterium]